MSKASVPTFKIYWNCCRFRKILKLWHVYLPHSYCVWYLGIRKSNVALRSYVCKVNVCKRCLQWWWKLTKTVLKLFKIWSLFKFSEFSMHQKLRHFLCFHLMVSKSTFNSCMSQKGYELLFICFCRNSLIAVVNIALHVCFRIPLFFCSTIIYDED